MLCHKSLGINPYSLAEIYQRTSRCADSTRTDHLYTSRKIPLAFDLHDWVAQIVYGQEHLSYDDQ